MNGGTQIAIGMSVLSCVIVSQASAQSPAERQAATRNAFPIPAGVRIVPDVVYAQYGERRLKLDVYRPPESAPKGDAPGIVVVRGNGWRSGDKEAFGFIAGQLAKGGFVAASIEYRVSAEAKFPAAVHDVKAAVRWMRAHASTYGIDRQTIGAIGASAGAHLVAMLATSGRVPELEGVGGNLATSSQVQAAVAMACPCNLQSFKSPTVAEFIDTPLEAHAEAIKAASPVTYVNSRSAPLLLLHSQTDPVVPFEQSLEIERLYRMADAPVVLTTIQAPNTHAFWNDAQYFPETIRQAVEFLRRHLIKAK